MFKTINSLWQRLHQSVLKKKSAGQKGEDEAAKFLKKKGLTIRDRNWRWKRYELDIIAEKENLLVFVEVKMRSSKTRINPHSLVNAQKMSYLKRAAKVYLKKCRLAERLFRFDVIVVLQQEDGVTIIEQFENFFPII